MASHAAGASERGQAAHQLFLDVQDQITDALARVDGGAAFKNDPWDREGGGGGRSRVLEEGRVFEKGGVNVSAVFGELPESFAKDLPGPGRRFFATGVSLVIHPRSPHVPTVHANFRYLEKGDDRGSVAWFGGGADLTPYVLYEEDAVHFHRSWRDVCQRHPIADHARFKKWCDEYFYIPHRGERRGVGGIFFDYFGLGEPHGPAGELSFVFAFVSDAAKSFLEAYLPIVERRKGTPGSEEDRRWQLERRGRYVEFNLIYDRGTVFGLKTGGRVESILMSLPNLATWKYDSKPNTAEQQALLDVLKTPRDWLA